MSIAKECNGIDDILNAYFGFLRRKTDFFGHMDRAQVAIDNQMKQQAAQYEREIAAEEAARKAKAAAAAAAAATAATASPPKGPSCTVSVPLRTGVIRSDSHGGTESMGGSGGRRQPVSPVHFFVRVPRGFFPIAHTLSRSLPLAAAAASPGLASVRMFYSHCACVVGVGSRACGCVRRWVSRGCGVGGTRRSVSGIP